jgi:hypothetical protein
MQMAGRLAATVGRLEEAQRKIILMKSSLRHSFTGLLGKRDGHDNTIDRRSTKNSTQECKIQKIGQE